MPGISPGAILREMRQAHALLKKARELLKHAKESPGGNPASLEACWASLTNAHRVMSMIPKDAIDDEVLTKQLALQRYATALLVRLRRLKRRESGDSAGLDDERDAFDDEESED